MIKLWHKTILENSDKEGIKEQYLKHDRVVDIAKQYRVSKPTIYRVLRDYGIDPAKGYRVIRECAVCGTEVKIRRGRARTTRNTYCSHECWLAYLASLGDTYKPNSYGCRAAKRTVSEVWPYYSPKAGHIVHHINKDQADNRICNLMVFASQRDHMRHHRGIASEPIWRGDT